MLQRLISSRMCNICYVKILIRQTHSSVQFDVCNFHLDSEWLKNYVIGLQAKSAFAHHVSRYLFGLTVCGVFFYYVVGSSDNNACWRLKKIMKYFSITSRPEAKSRTFSSTTSCWLRQKRIYDYLREQPVLNASGMVMEIKPPSGSTVTAPLHFIIGARLICNSHPALGNHHIWLVGSECYVVFASDLTDLSLNGLV